MFSGPARWFLLTALGSPLLIACGSDSPSDDGGAGMPSGGAGGSPTAGSASGGAGSPGGGAPSGGAGAGSGGAKAGAGGGGGAGGSSGGSSGGGSGGASGASGATTGGSSGAAGGGAGGGGGSGGAAPTAVAEIMGLNGETVTGTATFTQGAAMTKLVINLTACPDGKHSSHLHVMKDCGNNGTAAGNHWVPNGEMLGDYTCADDKVTHMVEKPTSVWTVGDGSATDVTKYAFMVHAKGDDEGSGDRIGCGVVNKK